MLTRRRMMVGAVGIVAAGVAGAVGIAVGGGKYGFIEAILRRNLPGVSLSDAEIGKFVEAYWPEFISPPRRRDAALRRLTVLAHAMVRSDFMISEETERQILTEFLIGSNFFQLSDPKSTAIEFRGLAGACPNPFYRT
jgi:hypothetical protein